MQLAKQRQGTSATKTRAMVHGGGGEFLETKRYWPRWLRFQTVLPYGLAVVPLWSHQPRSYAKKMPRKARRLALCCALSAKVAAGELVVVEGLAFDTAKRNR